MSRQHGRERGRRGTLDGTPDTPEFPAMSDPTPPDPKAALTPAQRRWLIRLLLVIGGAFLGVQLPPFPATRKVPPEQVDQIADAVVQKMDARPAVQAVGLPHQ